MIGDADSPGPDPESATAAAANLKRQGARSRHLRTRTGPGPGPGEHSVGCGRIATPPVANSDGSVRVVIGPALQRPGPAQPGPARGYGYLWRALMERAPTAPT